MLAVAIDNRRGVALLTFLLGIAGTRLLPDFTAIVLIQRDHFRSAAMNERQIQPIAVQQRRGGHAPHDVELPIAILHVEFPDFVPLEVVTRQIAAAHVGPDVLAVGAGRRRGRITFVAMNLLVANADDSLPNLLAVGGATQQHQVAAVDRRQKNVLLPHDRRRGRRPRQRQSPDNVFRRAPFRGQPRFAAHAVVRGPAPLRPILGAICAATALRQQKITAARASMH